MHRRQSAATRSIQFALAYLSIACGSQRAAAVDALPYQARVLAAGASVHSGPGENFYPTDTLSQGELVEVYQEKSGGWLGIRPPLNSFSWVAGRDLILKDGGLGEVVKDDVASRIGSRVNNKRNAAQVRLKKGEGVEVLGEEMMGGEKWYKIAPPAGEFRWIQKSLIERAGPIPKSLGETATTTTPPAPSTAPVTPPMGDSGAPPLIPTTTIPESNATTPAAPAQSATAASPSAPPTDGKTQSAPATGEFSQDLVAIELRLSRMAAAPPNLWNTERLERDAAQLTARAKTQHERDAARVTQEKINRFASITRRSNQTLGTVAQAGQGPATPAPNAVATNATGGPYDAVGILRPVVSRRPGAPQFALVDERGQVVSFVSPGPDLNLQPYLGHRVGIVGNRGYIPEFQRSNVTASRVTPLNDRLVR